MMTIDVITGVRFQPEHFLQRMAKSKKLSYIEFSHVNTVYSPCWVFQFRVALKASKKVTRYAGYYAGFEESTMAPGKLSILPSSHEEEVEAVQILADKLTEEEAAKRTWEYNKTGILRKFKNLNAPPVLEDYKVEKMYKPLYVIKFYNKELDDVRYKVLDSLSGDLEDITIQ